ncbi:MAG: hypothetical protein NZU63_01615 [Gemmataceae bacterium]|nr:hypothetical protein [Gemmataceae bacterium]MDW8243650.1 hypothetical protein [Thermogemmata sp.]
MAELTILLRRNPQTGKHDIIVKLHSDPDTLPMEHEQLHREQVAKLLGKDPAELGQLIITRESDAPVMPVTNQETTKPQRLAQQQG